MNKEIINEINNNLILLVEGFEDAERDYNYDLANEKHYVSEIIALVKKLTLTDVSKCDCSLLVACEICGEEKGLDGDFWKNKLKAKR